MSGLVSVGIGSAGATSFTIDAGYLVDRVANLLRRADMKNEILHWLNFAIWELTDKVDFPELRSSVETILIVSPSTYSYDLPADFSRIDDIYYRNTTDAANVWGRHLIPLPRAFYSGDTVDYERLLNVSVPSVGDPLYYFVDGTQLRIYPALASQNTGRLQMSYYKIHPDLTSLVDVPLLDKRWRPYLIWLTLYWGKATLEVEDMSKVGYWERKFTATIKQVGNLVRVKENPIETIELPDVGFEMSDSIY